MAEHVIKLPDVGEGVAEAELVEWHVKVGDVVRDDTVLAAVMTDKATVEIPSPVEGTVTWLGGAVGDTLAVGSPIVRIDIGGGAETKPAMDDGEGEASIADGTAEEGEAIPPPDTGKDTPTPDPSPQGGGETEISPPAEFPEAKQGGSNSPSPLWKGARGGGDAAPPGSPRAEGDKPLAAPAVRLRAKEAGIDLRQVPGSGPAGRITHDDLDVFIARGRQAAAGPQRNTMVDEIKVVGLRRRIAEKMALAWERIPHITYVEEIDVTELEALRAKLNAGKTADRPKLTILPFLMRAMVRAVAEQPQINALFDDEAGVVHRHGGVHIGIATQTPNGLIVPVVAHAEARDLYDCAAELNRLAEAARSGAASREELSGSTITITSLGAMGGVATTPVINHPEVAIVGVNKIMTRPVWDGAQFVPRKMMNLSSSFDHRVVDGWDAAVFVQRLKTLLESPALIFVEG